MSRTDGARPRPRDRRVMKTDQAVREIVEYTIENGLDGIVVASSSRRRADRPFVGASPNGSFATRRGSWSSTTRLDPDYRSSDDARIAREPISSAGAGSNGRIPKRIVRLRRGSCRFSTRSRGSVLRRESSELETRSRSRGGVLATGRFQRVERTVRWTNGRAVVRSARTRVSIRSPRRGTARRRGRSRRRRRSASTSRPSRRRCVGRRSTGRTARGPAGSR